MGVVVRKSPTGEAAPHSPDPDREASAARLQLHAEQLGAMEVDAPLAARTAVALAVLRLAIEQAFPGRIAVVSSFGAESAILLHLLAAVAPAAPVLFVETGKHFAQTLAYRKRLTAELGLGDVRDVRPQTDDLHASDPGGDLWRRDADACCAVRKVRPLSSALEGFDAWATGRKRFQGGLRAALPVFEVAHGKIKINPLASWSSADIDAYGAVHSLPAHPLVAEGFPSIGCWPCTRPAGPSEAARAGRWRGLAKSECGIHEI